MKIIDQSPKPAENDFLAKLPEPLKNITFFGGARKGDVLAEDTMVGFLEKHLSNKYTLLQNASLVGLDIPIPLILIGPQGVQVIYASSAKGVFRAKNDKWEKMAGGKYQPNRPNLITRTTLMARAVESFLNSQSLRLPEIQPVLFFANPGTHVDSIRPVVRIVLMDGLDPFATGILQSPTALTGEEVQKVVDLFTNQPEAPKTDEIVPASAGEQPISPLASASKRQTATSKISDNLTLAANKIHFTSQQWIILIAIGLLLFLMMAGFVFLIFLTF